MEANVFYNQESNATEAMCDWAFVSQFESDGWKVDSIHDGVKTNDVWLYKPWQFDNGQAAPFGIYVTITKSGKLVCGNYTGALPHIGEACFNVVFSENVSDYFECLSRAIYHHDLQFIRDFATVKWG